jgi:hypothetical protein
MMVSLSQGRVLVTIGFLAVAAMTHAQSGAVSIEVDYSVPSGHIEKRENGLVWFESTTQAVGAKCVYGLGPPMPSTGSLEADAEAALMRLVPRMMRTNDYRIARRGVAPAGWEYFLSGGHFQSQSGNYKALMAMVFPATANRVNLVFGIGSLSECTFNDVPFAQLFHSLHPRGWPRRPGNALERALIGAWGGSGLSGLTFDGNGRYSNSAAGQRHGWVISGGGNGGYTLRGAEITITPGAAGQPPERFRVAIYDTWHIGRWQRAMTVLYDDRRPAPYVAEYVRQGQ